MCTHSQSKTYTTNTTLCTPQESVHFLRYNKRDNSFYIFADDATPRYVTTVLPLDYDTVAVADKFGNVSVLRLPADVSAQVRGSAIGVRRRWRAATRRAGAPAPCSHCAACFAARGRLSR